MLTTLLLSSLALANDSSPSDDEHGTADGGHEATEHEAGEGEDCGCEHEEGEGEETCEGEHGEHGEAHHWIVGVSGANAASIAPEHVSVHGGLGVAAAYVVSPKILEIELAAKALSGEHGTAYPVELLFKKPFHASEQLHPFVAVGPGMVFAPEEAEVALESGEGEAEAEGEGTTASEGGALVGSPAVVLAAGSYLWLRPAAGLVVEVSVAEVFEAEPVQEVGGGLGLVLGF